MVTLTTNVFFVEGLRRDPASGLGSVERETGLGTVERKNRIGNRRKKNRIGLTRAETAH